MNIVFDLGGVLLQWNPKQVMAKYFSTPDEQQIAKEKIFGHLDWLELDRGTLQLDQAITRAAKRSGLLKEQVAHFLSDFPVELIPNPNVLKIIQNLHDSGRHKLYVLSNMHQHSVDYIEREYNFWHLFEGIVFSSPIKMIKPELEIYYFFLDKYNLRAEDSVFIDDREENIKAAERLNFKTIHFQNSDQCGSELKKLIEFS